MNVSIRAGNRRVECQPRRAIITLRQAMVLLLLVVATALVYLFTEVRALNVSYELSRAQAMQAELSETGRRLKVELNNLRSPERLEKEGALLGLKPPAPEQVRVLR